jgi:hypothetical protein
MTQDNAPASALRYNLEQSPKLRDSQDCLTSLCVTASLLPETLFSATKVTAGILANNSDFQIFLTIQLQNPIFRSE